MAELRGEENSFDPFPQDNITPEKYREAYESLSRFTQFDVNAISSFDDLVTHINSLGRSLHDVILSNGSIEEEQVEHDLLDEDSQEAVTRAYVIDRPVGDARMDCISRRGQVTISKYDKSPDGRERGVYQVILPSVSGLTSNSILEANRYIVYADDFRGTPFMRYQPLQHLNNQYVHRDYARLLKEAVGDVVSVISPPTRNL